MDRIKLKYAIDVLMGVSFLAVFITGVLKFPGFLSAFGVDIKTLPIRQISRLHDWTGLVMGILVFAHLALNWQWIKAMTKKYFGRNK